MGITPFGGHTPGYGQESIMPTAPWLMQKGQMAAANRQNQNNARRTKEANLQKLKDENYHHIMAHEMAHASAAGSLGGGIHIQYDGNGIPISGFVPIQIPGINSSNPAQSLAQARQVYAAATAPADMSSADASVASRAMSVMGQAQLLMDKQRYQLNNPLI